MPDPAAERCMAMGRGYMRIGWVLLMMAAALITLSNSLGVDEQEYRFDRKMVLIIIGASGFHVFWAIMYNIKASLCARIFPR